MDCDNCGKHIRFPLRDSKINAEVGTRITVVKYYCEACYHKFAKKKK